MPLPVPLLQPAEQQQLRRRLGAELSRKEREKRRRRELVGHLRSSLGTLVPPDSHRLSPTSFLTATHSHQKKAEKKMPALGLSKRNWEKGLGLDGVRSIALSGSDKLQGFAIHAKERLSSGTGTSRALELRCQTPLLLSRSEFEEVSHAKASSASPSGKSPTRCQSASGSFCLSPCLPPLAGTGNSRKYKYILCDAETPISVSKEISTQEMPFTTPQVDAGNEEDACVVLNVPPTPSQLLQRQVLEHRKAQRQQMLLRSSLPLFSWSSKGMATAAAAAKAEGLISRGCRGGAGSVPLLISALLSKTPSASASPFSSGGLEECRRRTATLIPRLPPRIGSEEEGISTSPANESDLLKNSQLPVTEHKKTLLTPRFLRFSGGSASASGRACGRLRDVATGEALKGSCVDSFQKVKWQYVDSQGLEDRRRLLLFLQQTSPASSEEEAEALQLQAQVRLLRSLEVHKNCHHPVVADFITG